MLQGHNIIILGSEKWASGNQTSKHHLVRQFIKLGASVLYIENISMRNMGSGGQSDLGKAKKIVKAILRGTTRPQENLICYTPLYLPFPKTTLVRFINTALLTLQFRILSIVYGFKQPIYIYFVPTGVLLSGRLNEKLSVYYIVDNFAAFDEVDKESVSFLENQALASANLVFATAETIITRLKDKRSDINYAPHGVDFNHFGQALKPMSAVPKEIKNVPKPIVGFMGSLAHDSVDLKLLERLAIRRPDWNFLLLGRQSSNIDSLRNLSNVYVIDPKPYEEMPLYLRYFDVALIPFLLNDLTKDLNPIKLREYLAAGLPVVSTDLPAIRPYREAISFAKSDDEWEQAISEKLEHPGSSQDRRQIVANESWENRAKAVAQLILDEIDR